MKALCAALCWALLGSAGASAETAVDLPAPVIFAPGVVSGPANDGAPTFAPDGRTLYFTRGGATWYAIFESHADGDAWSAPQLAPFSGTWSDLQPAMAPSGAYLIFSSWHAREGTSGRVAHLWRTERTGTAWSDPIELPGTVNISARVFKPSIAANGDLYFMSAGGTGGGASNFRLFRSAFVNGTYRQAEPLAFSDPARSDVDPEIAPDESFIVFSSSGRRSPNDHAEHLYLARRAATGWGPVMPIRYRGDDAGGNDNEPRLSRDGRTLYFSSDRSVPIHTPRTRAQAVDDLRRLDAWDNGNTNVWSLPLSGLSG